ncbi:MAG: beta-glucuronidase, partial [Prevotella sp.]|nr:beta-glucuronidase [Prevotella sp.]
MQQAWGADRKTTSTQVIDLSGEWEFQTGNASPPEAYRDRIMLPGSMLTNGKGNPVNINTPWTGSLYDSSYYFNPAMEKYRVEGQMKFPFFLTPEKHYTGHAWYRKTVRIPKSWKQQQVFLHLERPHIETTLYINQVKVGHQMSLSVPHDYDITGILRPGQENEIAICVYNGIENVCVGQDSHSVTDQTQGNWNGIVGRMELRTTPFIKKIRVFPDIHQKSVKILVNEAEYTIQMGDDAELWDEFHPRLYTRQVIYKGMPIDVTFGLREISIRDRQFYMNGKPVWMRGTVENCCFPLTGYPPTDVESWARIFSKCKEYGLNHMRFHSYCPPEAAFVAADSIGFYLQPEGPSWPNHGVKLRRGMSIDQYLLDESKAIVDRYGHHPSFVMMAAGNEPAGDWVPYCNDWVKEMKQYDPTKVYCGASVGGGWAWDGGSEYHVKGGARGLDWDKQAPHSDDDYFDQIEFPRNYKPIPSEGNERGANHSPILAHEQGQWCAFPDLKETSQYTGAYKARNFEIFADLLAKNGMASQAENFLYASGRLQTTAYKYEIERNLRTRDYAGFQLLGLNDYSGQGTALEGVLNVFWREKQCLRPDGTTLPYTNASEWREFCSPIVPLARFPKFVFESNEKLSIPFDIYNASGAELRNVTCRYQIEECGVREVENDTFGIETIPLGKNSTLGTISINLSTLSDLPKKLTLTISITDKQGSVLGSNHWEFWVYPHCEMERGERRE